MQDGTRLREGQGGGNFKLTHYRLKEQAQNEIRAKFAALIQEKKDLREKRVRLAERDRALDRDLADCVAAARLFGQPLELPPELQGPRAMTVAEMEMIKQRNEAVHAARLRVERVEEELRRREMENMTHGPVMPRQHQPPMSPLSQPITAIPMPKIKDIALDRAKAAGADGIKASAIRDYIANTYRQHIHEKTVGMTLYRLLKDGKVSRDRHTWFIVPEAVNPGAGTPGSVTKIAEERKV